MQKDITSVPFTGYQKFVIFILAVTQFSVILDFMVMSPMGDLLMKSLALKPAQFGIAVSAYAFSAGTSGYIIVVISFLSIYLMYRVSRMVKRKTPVLAESTPSMAG